MNRDDAQREAVDSALFARYAEADIDRWRTLVGGTVEHADARWGTGHVEDVRWATSGHGVPPCVQVRVRYPDHGLVVYRADSFHTHHRLVTVPAEVRRFIRVCFEEERSVPERAAMLERHAREIRAAWDREMLSRVEAMKRRIRRPPDGR